MDYPSPEELQQLRAAADEARPLNYSPYSRVLALAAAETVLGGRGGGSNVENANLSLTKHAEELAIIAAFRDDGVAPAAGRLRCVYIAGPPPCGGCRQFAAEFGGPQSRWIFEAVEQSVLRSGPLTALPTDRPLTVVPFAEALPFAFSPGAVGL